MLPKIYEITSQCLINSHDLQTEGKSFKNEYTPSENKHL